MKKSKHELRKAMPFLGSNAWRGFKLAIIAGALLGGLNVAYWAAEKLPGLQQKITQGHLFPGGHPESALTAPPAREVAAHAAADKDTEGLPVPTSQNNAEGQGIESMPAERSQSVSPAVKNYAVAQNAFKKNQATLENLLEE